MSTLDGSAWLAGWYATKLHFVPDVASRHTDTFLAVCGAWVYRSPKTEWAARNLEHGIPRCKKCERLLSKNEKPCQ